VPLQADVCMHVPLPEGVLHLLDVQHLMSEEPEHRLDVVLPLQQPPDTDTHTPSMPPELFTADNTQQYKEQQQCNAMQCKGREGEEMLAIANKAQREAKSKLTCR
jgi:hypothetical protein